MPTETERAETEKAVRHLLWHVGDQRNGMEPGGFTTRLLDAWVHADAQNSAALSAAFPALGFAVPIARSQGRDGLLAALTEVHAGTWGRT